MAKRQKPEAPEPRPVFDPAALDAIIGDTKTPAELEALFRTAAGAEECPAAARVRCEGDRDRRARYERARNSAALGRTLPDRHRAGPDQPRHGRRARGGDLAAT